MGRLASLCVTIVGLFLCLASEAEAQETGSSMNGTKVFVHDFEGVTSPEAGKILAAEVASRLTQEGLLAITETDYANQLSVENRREYLQLKNLSHAKGGGDSSLERFLADYGYSMRIFAKAHALRRGMYFLVVTLHESGGPSKKLTMDVSADVVALRRAAGCLALRLFEFECESDLQGADSADYAGVAFEIAPTGAWVEIGGVKVCELVPCVVKLQSGTREATFHHPACHSSSAIFEVPETAVVTRRLKFRTGKLLIVPPNRASKTYVSGTNRNWGQKLDSTPAGKRIDCAVGSWVVRVDDSRGFFWEGEVTVAEGIEAIVRPQLVRLNFSDYPCNKKVMTIATGYGARHGDDVAMKVESYVSEYFNLRRPGASVAYANALEECVTSSEKEMVEELRVDRFSEERETVEHLALRLAFKGVLWLRIGAGKTGTIVVTPQFWPTGEGALASTSLGTFSLDPNLANINDVVSRWIYANRKILLFLVGGEKGEE